VAHEADAAVNPPEGGDPSDKAGIRAIYDSERRDEQSTAGLIIAVSTGTLAYIVAGGAYLADRNRQAKLQPEILMVAPFPLLILSGYITFQYAASRLRQSYLMHLERQLSPDKDWHNDVLIPGYISLHQGLFSGLKSRLWAFAALTLLTFLAHIALVVTFTGYTAYIAHRENVNEQLFWVLAPIYGVMILINICAVALMIAYALLPNRGRQLRTLRDIAYRTMESEERRWENSRFNSAPLPRLRVSRKLIGAVLGALIGIGMVVLLKRLV
jgi:hypothetical protein